MQAVETFECILHDSTSTGRVEYFYKYSGLSAIRIPRELLPGCSGFQVLQNPGVYFLFGPVDPGDEDSPMAVYVGQSESVWERLMCHFRSSSKTLLHACNRVDKASQAMARNGFGLPREQGFPNGQGSRTLQCQDKGRSSEQNPRCVFQGEFGPRSCHRETGPLPLGQ